MVSNVDYNYICSVCACECYIRSDCICGHSCFWNGRAFGDIASDVDPRRKCLPRRCQEGRGNQEEEHRESAAKRRRMQQAEGSRRGVWPGHGRIVGFGQGNPEENDTAGMGAAERVDEAVPAIGSTETLPKTNAADSPEPQGAPAVEREQ